MRVSIIRRGKNVAIEVAPTIWWKWTFESISEAIAFTLKLTKKHTKVRVHYGRK